MTEKPGSRAPRAKRGVLIGGAVGLVFLAVVGAWTLARAELGAERARAALVHVLGARLGARVTLRQVELSWSERRVRAHGVSVRGGWGVVTARELSAEVSWLDLVQGELAPDGFELRGADVRLDARGGAGAGQGGAGVDLAALRSLRLFDSTLSVQLSSGGVVALAGARLELDGERVALVAQRGSYAAEGGRTLALGGVELKGRRRGQALSFEQGVLSLGGTRVALSALELPRPFGHSARGRVHAEGALGPLLALALGRDGTTATPAPAASATAAFDGKAVIDGTFALGPRGASFELDATHQRATLHLSRTEGAAGLSLRTQLGQGAFTGKAELVGERIQVELVSDDASIADVAASLPALLAAQSAITGRGKVVLRVEGTVSAPTLALRAELHDATLLGARFERAAFGLQSGTEPGALSIDALSLQTGRGRVLADALVLRARADGGLDATGELRVEKLPLPSLWRLLGMPEGAAPVLLTGEVDGKVTLAHDDQHERAGARATLDVQLHGASLRGLRFASGSLDATLGADGRIELRSLALREGGASLTLSGTLGGTGPHAGPVDVKAKLERLALSQLAAGASAWLGLSGTASGTASFGGSAAAPEARIEVTLDQLALLGIPLGPQALRAELVSAAVLARGCGEGAPEAELAPLRSGLATGPGARAWLLCGGSRGVHAALALGSGDELPVRGRLTLERAALGSLLSFTATGEGKPVPARATFALDLTGGGLRNPGSLSFTLAVRELSIGEGAHALVASAPFELRAKHGALSLQGGELTTEHTRLVLGAEGSLPHARLTAKGAIAAGALLAASPVPLVTDAFGEVGIDAALPLDASPGYFRLEPREAIVHLGPGIALRKVRGSIALEPDGLRLDGVTAVVGGGTLRASGTLRRSGGKLDRYDLALVAQDVEIEPAPRFTLGFDADVRLRSVAPGGQLESKTLPTLSGHVRVERFLYGRHIELPEALIAMNQADRRERASYQPARDRVAFDLELEQAAPLLVRNRMIDAELRVQGQARTLHVVGTNQRFGLLGGMEVARGRVLFHGDEFEITRGAVTFGEQTRVAPVFELRAVAKKRTRKDASIVLVAKGDRETFALDIHCDAGAARVLAPPFACAFAHDQLRCDRFEQLATLWSCPVRTELSRAEGH